MRKGNGNKKGRRKTNSKVRRANRKARKDKK